MKSSDQPNFKLSPSDLTFLWEGCPFCFYNKVRHSLAQPRMPFPTVFNRIHAALAEGLAGKRTEQVIPELPPGTFVYSEKWVQSDVIVLPGRDATCFLRGRFDMVAEFDDGSYGIIDFKTAETRSVNVPLYTRQLAAYRYALEHPAPGKLGLGPVRVLGIYCVEPRDLVLQADGFVYRAQHTWIDIPADEQAFLEFIDMALAVLESPTAPPPAAKCGVCSYAEFDRPDVLG